jgi:hypothetical protein
MKAQTSSVFKSMTPPQSNISVTPFPSFAVKNAVKDWVPNPRINSQQLFVDPKQIGTFQNDNDTKGMPVYGHTLNPYVNMSNYPHELDKILDIERLENSAHLPYFDKYVDSTMARQQYDWARNYVANVSNGAHTGMIPSVNYLQKKNITLYN